MKRKKIIVLGLSLLMVNSIALLSCQNTGSDVISPNDHIVALDKEIKGCYNFFKAASNLKEGSSGYGLIRDRMSDMNNSSIASTGFGLAGYPIFVEQGYISKDDAKKIVEGTFDTILRLQNDVNESYEGCLYHFVDMNSGIHKAYSEISTIDTAILIGGVITSMEYFKDSTSLYNKGLEIWGNVNYKAYEHGTKNGGRLISMGAKSNHTLLGDWDMTAEQLMMYVFGAGNPTETYRLDQIHYNAFNKPKGTYADKSIYYTWNGSIFTYQFSHAFVDFSQYSDAKGINWWQNSIDASIASYQYCVDNKEDYKTYSESSWGLTACDTPLGYSGELGALPRGGGITDVDKYLLIQGTIPPAGALGSMMFTPKQSLDALYNYQSNSKLNDEKFGLKDAYCLNFNGTKDWYDDDYIGIDKGISLLMLYSYKNNKFIQNLVMQNEYIIEGLTNIGFKKVIEK